ncbi:hypothetical protein Kpho02_59340 [Kitasatospora phosalacinea]|uniref:SHOCT domain-containing protein n=1 Tax=Kitasatospora phosalacinea TaxID=2065 RepID=A0A9W6QAW6_9ACTN|nr:DUF4429 domain-containing protein [Kitasatospora phosalacinea]GLW73635.1 hypothetical protein Kpho02_59340 [Kitasatospora phosalacinea]
MLARGDGLTGQAQHAADAVPGLPAVLTQPVNAELRGEVLRTTAQFEEANRIRLAHEAPPFLHPHSGAARPLRAKDCPYRIELTFFARSVIGLDEDCGRTALLERLAELGTHTAASTAAAPVRCESIEQVQQRIEETTAAGARGSLPGQAEPGRPATAGTVPGTAKGPLQVEPGGGSMDGERASVRVGDPVPGTALISSPRAYPGGRPLYEPDAAGCWTWWGGTRRRPLQGTAVAAGPRRGAGTGRSADPGLMIEAKGHNGQVTFDGEYVTITRKGFLARTSVGKGEKRIHISQIAAVQWKPPGKLVNGFIQFTVPGGIERRSGFGNQTNSAIHDENSVIVMKNQAAAFEELREAVDEAIARQHRPLPTDSLADELTKLQQLAESGALSAQEYESAKARILGS